MFFHSHQEAPDRPADRAVRRANLRRVVRLFKPYRGKLSAVLALIMFSAALGVIPAFLLRGVINAIRLNESSRISYLAGGMIAIAVISGVLGVVQTLFSNQVGQRVIHDLRTAVFRHLQRLSLAFFTRTRTGEVQSRISNDIGGVQGVVTNTATSIASNVTTVDRDDGRHARPELGARALRLRAHPVLRPPYAPRRRRAPEDREDDAGDARGHLEPRPGVAVGQRDPARQDDGTDERARGSLRGRLAPARRSRGAPAHGRPLGDGDDPDELLGDAGRRLLVRRRQPRRRDRDDRRVHDAADTALLPGRLAARRAARRADLARALRPDLRVPRPADRHRGEAGCARERSGRRRRVRPRVVRLRRGHLDARGRDLHRARGDDDGARRRDGLREDDARLSRCAAVRRRRGKHLDRRRRSARPDLRRSDRPRRRRVAGDVSLPRVRAGEPAASRSRMRPTPRSRRPPAQRASIT